MSRWWRCYLASTNPGLSYTTFIIGLDATIQVSRNEAETICDPNLESSEQSWWVGLRPYFKCTYSNTRERVEEWIKNEKIKKKQSYIIVIEICPKYYHYNIVVAFITSHIWKSLESREVTHHQGFGHQVICQRKASTNNKKCWYAFGRFEKKYFIFLKKST